MGRPGLFPRRLIGAGVLAALLSPQTLTGASFPPRLRFRSVSTGRVTVHFHQGLEGMAREAAVLATEILEGHERRYQVRVGRVQVVLADVEDDPNGFASPLPYPLVHVRAVAPDGSDEFGNYESWLRLVLAHELAHIVHLDQARGVLGLGRKLFGRAPFLFPNAATTPWMIEGLATYEETEGTAFGRGRNPDSRMVLRMAALEGDFPQEDRPVLGLDRWPDGQAPYLFGESFMRELTARYGSQTLPELARVHAGRVVPYADDLTALRVTGASFHTRWREWRAQAVPAYLEEAALLRAAGLTVSRPVTRRGIRQVGPRFSPDGSWIAYTNRNLTRFRAIHLVRPDGSGDRRLVHRNGGATLAWTPDGRRIVYEEPEVHRLFAIRSDLRVVEVESGRVRRLSRGLRARDPDVSPDGRSLVFVRQDSDRSELAVMALDGSGRRDITRSEAQVQWSGPRWSPDGRALVAARWSPGGWLDLARVDPQTGAVTELTRDRARDVEPAWTPDGRYVVFRSDRTGVSNLHALRVEDGALLQLTNVVGGAFSPDISPDGRRMVFASYSARGYDVHLAELALGSVPPAADFQDPYPPPHPPLAVPPMADRPYSPLAAMRPRFWSPYVAGASGETRFGLITGGADPLLRHAYGLDLHTGSSTGGLGFQAFYQYDRFRPTLLLSLSDTREPEQEDVFRTQELLLRASLPIRRTLRSTQSLSLSWRRSRESQRGPGGAERLELGGLEAAWALSTARQYPYSISPIDGGRLRVAYLYEDPILGSELALGKLVGDARAYRRLLGESDTLALRVGGGATFGRPSFRRSFAVGGFPDGSLFDLVRTNHSVLRGYPQDAFSGRRFAHANVEYRFPLARPQRGVRSLPVFLRHLHGAVFADAAHAWSGAFQLRDLKTGAGVALGADLQVAHVLPLTGTVGLARGFSQNGETSLYFRAGLAF